MVTITMSKGERPEISCAWCGGSFKPDRLTFFHEECDKEIADLAKNKQGVMTDGKM